MSLFEDVLKDNWAEVEEFVTQQQDNIVRARVNTEKVQVLSKINKMTPGQVSKMMSGNNT